MLNLKCYTCKRGLFTKTFSGRLREQSNVGHRRVAHLNEQGEWEDAEGWGGWEVLPGGLSCSASVNWGAWTATSQNWQHLKALCSPALHAESIQVACFKTSTEMFDYVITVCPNGRKMEILEQRLSIIYFFKHTFTELYDSSKNNDGFW